MLKYTLIFIIAALSAVLCQQDQKTLIEEEKIFNAWLKRHGIDVPADADFNKWKANVIAKFREHEKHNEKYRKGEELFMRGINHLSHLSNEELKATVLGFSAPTADDTLPVVSKDALKDLPDYFNWHDKGIVQPPQDQKQCGSCYIFSTIGAIEAHSCYYNHQCEKLSEQEALECSDGRGCNGGWSQLIYKYTQSKNGATALKNYGYQAKVVNKCEDAGSRPRVNGTTVVGWKTLPKHADTIKFYLYSNGPMFVGFDVYQNFVDYKSGIYHNISGDKLGGHAVLLIGYGTENGVDYWILKNSWTTNWGESGFFRFKRGVDLCGIESGGPTYPIMS
ncbi:hypothetical protein PVAND_015803 [Polypedilum vanderplanki]|uniref:Peptidase C1A papain C-terminal domain-containing protein n=1 Tax=Polypedilum vanderplanki TaxID=319348 RepID=A0A9J6BDP5_POLVA|nr:hypothetical protein PVAND_015803 [Polypedilum vanderplanki]